MAVVQRNADLRVSLEAPDAGAVAGARVDDKDWGLRGVEAVVEAVVADAVPFTSG
jgi:hypothetical protein